MVFCCPKKGSNDQNATVFVQVVYANGCIF